MSNSLKVRTVKIIDNVIEKEISDGKYRMPFQIKVGNNVIDRKALFILHGHGANKRYAKFHDDNWIVICPLDIYGTENLGSWWLGEKGGFFTFRLLQGLIDILKEEYKLQKIFFWGSSMGGYGSILHGTICNADAIYAHMPQVKLKGTDYTDGINSKFYFPIFGESTSDYEDLTKFLNVKESKSSPIYFLSQNVFDYPNYISQHFIPLIKTMDSKGFAYSVEMNLEEGHKIFRSIASTVNDIFTPNLSKISKYRKASKSLSNSIANKVNIDISYNDKLVEVSALHNINGHDFACYLYINNKSISKQKFKSNPDFSFQLVSQVSEGDVILIKYYLRSIKDKSMRVSRTFSKVIK